MDDKDYLIVIATPLLTFLFNYLFYRFIKGDIEQKIHQNNISYSGVFQEKLEVYKGLLEKIYITESSLKKLVIQGKNQKEVLAYIDDFLKYATINQPFLTEKMIKDLRALRIEFSNILWDANNLLVAKSDVINNTSPETFDSWLAATKKIMKEEPFTEIKERIMKQMKSDLQTVEGKNK
ncbi:hypothetical protein V6B16_01275 [Salinimicrobium catena]|uniref:hypothetical protein n=1 Tax=Salinimicrobium catena TaxID=390640 RepID=UPI002FE4D757